MSKQRVFNLTISLEMLEKAGACEEGIAAFRGMFGESADLTIRNIRKAQKAGLDVEWLAKLMTPEALKTYDEAIAPALKANKEAAATARKAYYEAVAPALLKGLRESL